MHMQCVVLTRLLFSPQRYNLIQLWRATSRFVQANLQGLSVVLNCVDAVNKNEGWDKGPFRPQLLRENTGLLDADYREFADFMMQQPKLTFRDMNVALVQARKRRMARWHVYGAPDSYITAEKRMCLNMKH